MMSKTYLLVFPSSAASAAQTPAAIGSAIEVGETFYALEGNICFVQTAQTVEGLTRRLSAGPLKGEKFFLVAINDAPQAGNMSPAFWQHIRSDRMSSVA